MAYRWPLWARASRAWRSVERAIPRRAHSSRSAGSRVPGASSPRRMAVPNRSTVSSSAVTDLTGAKTASSGSNDASVLAVIGLEPLEPSIPLPVRDRGVEGLQLNVRRVDVMPDYLLPEGVAGDLA